METLIHGTHTMVTVQPVHELDQFGPPGAPGSAVSARQEARRLARRQRLAHAWIPIRQLKPRHRAKIVDHLLQLDEGDRYLRFGFQATAEQMKAYAASINFKRDDVFGVFNSRLQLIAVSHLADLGDLNHPAMAQGHGHAMEFGVSVLPWARGLGLGQRLFNHAVMHARNRHAHALVIHALTENRPMLKIAARAGAQVETNGADSEAWLRLPKDNLASHLEGTAQDMGAELVFRWKAQVQAVRHRLQQWLSV